MILDNPDINNINNQDIYSFPESIEYVTLNQILDDPRILAQYIYRQAVNTDNLGEDYQNLDLHLKELKAEKRDVVNHTFGHIGVNIIPKTFDEVQLIGELVFYRTSRHDFYYIFKTIYNLLINRSMEYVSFVRRYLLSHIKRSSKITIKFYQHFHVQDLEKLSTEHLLILYSQIAYEYYKSELREYSIYYIDDYKDRLDKFDPEDFE